MSQANVETIRRLYERRPEKGAPLSDALDEEFELHPDPAADWVGVDDVFRGRDGIRGYLAQVHEAFEYYRPEVEGFLDADDKVIALASERARGRGSGATVEARRTAHVWTMRGDKAIRLDLHLDRANALAALGLSGQAMSEANAEALRAAIEAFNSDGVDAALPYLHPEIVWNAPPEWLEKAVYRGHEGLRELAASWGQNFDAYRLDVERVVELGGGRALVLLHQRGRIKGSGHPMEQAVAWIVELVHRRLTRVDVYFTWGAAIEAAGIRVQPDSARAWNRPRPGVELIGGSAYSPRMIASAADPDEGGEFRR